ncbi:hypothetical protein Tco_0374153 [Tanacetum coccineum]
MIVAQRVANDIETIAIYEAKTRVARDLTNQVKRQEDKFHHTGPCTENVAIASGLVIKLEIVGPQSRERNRGPQWQNRRPKLPVMSVKARTLQE